MNRKHLSRHLSQTLLLILLFVYWAVSLRHLTTIPPVYEDEPWQASTGWKLSTEGVFGTDLFTGFYGMEQHYYGYMPVHPFLLAAVFKLIGLGLFQARFEPVVLGLLTLSLTYALGKRLFRPSIGLLAVFLLIFTRTAGLTPSQYSGIILIDIARIARYDPAVPVFALTALLLYASHLQNQLALPAPYALRITHYASTPYVLRFTFYAFLGFLTALTALSHLYGLFYFPAFLLLLLWQRANWRQIAAFIVGFLLPWLIYLAYVVPGWPDWVGQTRDYAPRFELFNLNWYWQNFINERQRYGPGLGSGTLFRPGFWTAAIIVPLALLALGRRALQGDKKAQTLVVPAIILPLLFALLIYLKLSNYLITVAPLFALLMAWGLHKLWQSGPSIARMLKTTTPQITRLLHAAVALLLLLIALEGTTRFVHLDHAAAATTPYADYAAEIQSHLPPNGRILALHNYWFNFQSWDYRSWSVPLLQNNPRYWQPPLSIAAALDGIDPTIILIDPRMRQLFEADPETAEAIFTWMTANGFQQTAAVQDPTYGRMDIYLTPNQPNQPQSTNQPNQPNYPITQSPPPSP